MRDGTLCVFDVEQHIIEQDPSRRIVSITPKAYIDYPFAEDLHTGGFKRKKFTDKGINVVHEVVSDRMSLAANSSFAEVSIQGDTFQSLKVRLATVTKPKISDVERLLRVDGVESPAKTAALLFPLLSAGDYSLSCTTSKIKCEGFQSIGPLATEDGKPGGRQIAPSIVTEPALFPMNSVNNDVASVHGRVKKVANNKCPPKKYYEWANEFIHMLVPESHIGTPLTHEEVIEIQNRPSQRNRSALVECSLTETSFNSVSAFMKKEAYGSTNDPRNISQVSTTHTINLSAYTYAFKNDVLKNLGWYGPGKTPLEVHERLAELCADGTICRDYSRFDGTISEFLQTLVVRPAYLRWCNAGDRTMLQQLLIEEDRAKAVTANGIKYDPGFSRKSGSPVTTDANTLINAFNAYCALRLLGYSKEEAWKALGLYCGDDGVDKKVKFLSEAFEEVARDLGLLIKSHETKPGEDVPYCGRLFSDPCSGTTSIQDPMRTLQKIHLSSAPESVPDKIAACNKAAGYVVTDANTPIVGAWCKKVVSFAPDNDFTRQTREEQWKMNASWPQDSPDDCLRMFCDVLNLTSGDVADIEAAIEAATSLETLPEGILENGDAVKHKLAAIVGDRIVGPTPLSQCDITQQECLLDQSDKHSKVLVTQAPHQSPMGQTTSTKSGPAVMPGSTSSEKTSEPCAAKPSSSASTSKSAGSSTTTHAKTPSKSTSRTSSVNAVGKPKSKKKKKQSFRSTAQPVISDKRENAEKSATAETKPPLTKSQRKNLAAKRRAKERAAAKVDNVLSGCEPVLNGCQPAH
jgi:hypothetical protein